MKFPWLGQVKIAGIGRSDEGSSGMLFISPRQRLVFLTQRSDKVSHSGLWSIPGGGTEPGETPLEGALRETREEVGSVPSHRVIGMYLRKRDSYPYTTFVAAVDPETADSWIPRLNFESSDAAWFFLDNLPEKIHPGTLEAIRHAVRIFGLKF